MLGVGELREHRQAERFAAGAFRDGELALAAAQRGVGGLEMDAQGVIDAAADGVPLEMRG